MPKGPGLLQRGRNGAATCLGAGSMPRSNRHAPCAWRLRVSIGKANEPAMHKFKPAANSPELPGLWVRCVSQMHGLAQAKTVASTPHDCGLGGLLASAPPKPYCGEVDAHDGCAEHRPIANGHPSGTAAGNNASQPRQIHRAEPMTANCRDRVCSKLMHRQESKRCKVFAFCVCEYSSANCLPMAVGSGNWRLSGGTRNASQL